MQLIFLNRFHKSIIFILHLHKKNIQKLLSLSILSNFFQINIITKTNLGGRG